MQASNRKTSLRYFLLAAGVVALALAGYGGYILYPRFDLPSVTGAGLFVIAAMAGVASFFSPCSFPLLVTLMSRSIGAETGHRRGAGVVKARRAAQYGAALAAGAGAFLLLVGAGIALGGATLFERVTFVSTAGRALRLGVGLLLVILGLVQTGSVSLPFDKVGELARPMQKAQAKLRRQRPTLGFGLFGFGYILAGFG